MFATGSALTEPRLREYDDVDLSAITLRFPSGALVQIDCVRQIGYGYDERIEVLGADGHGRSAPTSCGRRLAVCGQTASSTTACTQSWFDRIAASYRAALDHFVDALQHGSPIGPDLSEALKAQAIAEAATLSLNSGRMEPVQYPALTAVEADARLA